MGLLDSVLGMAQQAMSGQSAQGGTGGSADLLQAALGMLGGGQEGEGQAPGIGGLVQAFQQGGLGNVIQSWIGTGQNLPISAEQIQAVLGGSDGPLAQMAGKLGMNPADVAGHLSQLLPQLIDHATPNGQVPEGGLGQLGNLGSLGSLADLATKFLAPKA